MRASDLTAAGRISLRTSKDYGERDRLTRFAQRFGLRNSRNLFWYRGNDAPLNFGDWIGPLVYESRTGRIPSHCPVRKLQDGGTVYFTVGSILHFITRPDCAIVWGSGIIERDTTFSRPREITAVRGPLSRERCRELGYDCPEVFGDPAILLPGILPAERKAPRYRLGIIPHYVHHEEVSGRMPQSDEVLLIDVRRPVQEVCEDIRNCAATVSSSLHGLIVSHAFGVPSAWMTFSAPLYGDNVKFEDYFASAGIVEQTPHQPDDGPLDLAHLAGIANASAMLDLAGLEDKLLKSCPF